jgi:demethylmenaquinone methyltransferase/2-methoxy-6-polyprenyl-1,4-benzoquinol methylase
MWLLRAVGVRDWEYRRQASDDLNLGPGDTVVDLGSGTGLNFPYLIDRAGPSGRVVGVDLTDAMLARGRDRPGGGGWTNVTLGESDVGDFEFPTNFDGAILTLALTLSPAYGDVARRAAAALRLGDRIAIVDLNEPTTWPNLVGSLRGVDPESVRSNLDLAQRHPWESVRRYFREVCFREFYHGAIYLSVGEAGSPEMT